MSTEVLYIPSISCTHCTQTIERELQALPGIHTVQADLDTRRVIVSYAPPADEHTIAARLAEIGYPLSLA